MKLRRVFLGAAVVALMAACGGKTETTTETATPAEETHVEAVAEEPVEEAEAPVAKNDAKPAAKSDKAAPAAKEDPCKAKVEKFEKFVDNLAAAQKNKASSPEALKEFAKMLKVAAAEEAAVEECVQNPEYKSRVKIAITRCKQIRSTK